MGRQFRFHMALEDERWFFDYVYGVGGVILPGWPLQNVNNAMVTRVPDPFEHSGWWSVYLCPSGLQSEVRHRFVERQAHYVLDGTASPVIEMTRSIPGEDSIMAGRLWCSFEYWEGSSLVKKPPQLRTFFDSLTRHLRRTCTRNPELDTYVAPKAIERSLAGIRLLQR